MKLIFPNTSDEFNEETNSDLGIKWKWTLKSCSEVSADDGGISFLKTWYIYSARNGVNGPINFDIVKRT